jgi:transcription termination/antitermination protein NusG
VIIVERVGPESHSQNLLPRLPAVGDNAAMNERPSDRFSKGDRVRVNDGIFNGYEGIVEEVDEKLGRVAVFIQIFGRTTPVQLEQRQLDPA